MRRSMTLKPQNDTSDVLAEINEVLSSAEEQTDLLMRRYDLTTN